jgi:hypothetical protein
MFRADRSGGDLGAISLDPFAETTYTSRMTESEQDNQGSVLPSALRLLCVGAREPSWALLTMQLGSQGCHEPQFRWSSTANEALTLLRREIFDTVIIVSEAIDRDGEFGWRNVLALVDAVRAGGHDDPVLLIAPYVADDKFGQLSRHDCDVLCSSRSWESPALVPLILRMIDRNQRLEATRRLESSHRRQVSRDKSEAERLLREQQRMVQDVRLIGYRSMNAVANTIPEEHRSYYQTLLRTHGMMGEGSLSAEVSQFAKQLRAMGATPGDALEMHLQQTEQLIARAGSRSSRHLVSRADLLAIELLLYLGQEYCGQPQDARL